jgi:hypothetical protein
MKYFTPELIARGQVNDHDLLDRHEEEWDRVCASYEAYLKTVAPDMPPGLKHIEESYYLHDASVLSIGRRGKAFVLVLQLDTPPRSILTFTYDLLGEPVVKEDALPPVARMKCDPPLWLYNEVERVEGKPGGWREDLLLSNGWEVALHFRDVKVEEFEAILPVTGNGRARQPALVPTSSGDAHAPDHDDR